MGVQPWVTGFVNVLVGDDQMLLGTCERYPRFTIRSGFVPYFNDISGPVIPSDSLWVGKEAFIFLDLNRWDEDVLQFIRTITSNDGDDPLNWSKDSVGTLMIHEDEAIPVTLQYPYASKAAYAGMPNGYTFSTAWFEGPEEFSVLGTNPAKVHVVFHALPAEGDDGSWSLGEIL